MSYSSESTRERAEPVHNICLHFMKRRLVCKGRALFRLGQARSVSTDLSHSVSPYSQHIFVASSQSWGTWPARLEGSRSLLTSLHNEIKAQRLPVLITAFEVTERNDQAFEVRPDDLVLFPEAVRIRGLTEDQIPAFIASLQPAKDTGESPSATQNPTLTQRVDHRPLPAGLHAFVCCHESRDVRCGRCGPPIVRALAEEAARLARPGLSPGPSGFAFPGGLFPAAAGEVGPAPQTRVSVWPCSHVGGHKYAGNVLIYPPGDWFGYVTEDNARAVLQDAVRRLARSSSGSGSGSGSRIVPEPAAELLQYWRGRMGPPSPAQIEAQAQKLKLKTKLKVTTQAAGSTSPSTGSSGVGQLSIGWGC